MTGSLVLWLAVPLSAWEGETQSCPDELGKSRHIHSICLCAPYRHSYTCCCLSCFTQWTEWILWRVGRDILEGSVLTNTGFMFSPEFYNSQLLGPFFLGVLFPLPSLQKIMSPLTLPQVVDLVTWVWISVVPLAMSTSYNFSESQFLQ